MDAEERGATGMVERIHVASAAGAPMRPLRRATVIANEGVVGDRYAVRRGHWADDKVSRDVTLVEAEVIEDLQRVLGVRLAPGETRRNVTTRGIRLHDLVDRLFWLGNVLCRGTSLCEPCRHLEQLTGKPLIRALVHRGGLRADSIISGEVRPGDPIIAVDVQPGVGVVAIREGRLLVGRRLGAHGRGTWSTPGGKPLPHESTIECALRELWEETGLTSGGGREVARTLDGFASSRLVFDTRFVEVDQVAGRVRAREPEKTDRWEWRNWDDLPEPLFPPVASLVSSGYLPNLKRS
jgi:8-oxo-dGTP pyrophosphatase MutT (NUDIX family)